MTKWGPFWVKIAAIVLVVGAVCEIVGHLTSGPSENPSPATMNTPALPIAEASTESGEGTLQIWVAGGAEGVDDEYWVYLNGRLVNASSPSPGGAASIPVPTAGRDGWLYEFDSPYTRVVLESRDGVFDTLPHDVTGDANLIHRVFGVNDYADEYIDSRSGDAKHLFRLVKIDAAAGRYDVEVAYRSHRPDSFPFAITPKQTVTVKAADTERIFVGLPDDWVGPLMIPSAARDLSACRGEKPNVDLLESSMRDYQADPVVMALEGVNLSSFVQSDSTAVLDLPPALGGPREFDRREIAAMAGEVLSEYSAPTAEAVAQCKRNNPNWPASYDSYANLLAGFEDQKQFLNVLAAS